MNQQSFPVLNSPPESGNRTAPKQPGRAIFGTHYGDKTLVLRQRRVDLQRAPPGLLKRLGFALLLLLGSCACSDPLPEGVQDYRAECQRMTCDPIPKKPDDPHNGVKHVYACGIELADLMLNERPFEDGVTIVKESIRDDTDYAWLVATARKQGGRWHWDEYTRNFEDEEFRRIAASESVCIDCHKKVEDSDFIYTFFNYTDACPD
jgi:hypothetical protein